LAATTAKQEQDLVARDGPESAAKGVAGLITVEAVQSGGREHFLGYILGVGGFDTASGAPGEHQRTLGGRRT
jgi:hypothetical protein